VGEPVSTTHPDKYLAGYIGQNSRVPEISLECVMAAAGLIEKMGRERLKPRKDGAQLPLFTFGALGPDRS
jgi:hypothetical protein